MVTAIALATSTLASVNGPSISAHALKADLSVLREALTTIHAGLYRYQTPAQFDANFKALEGKLSHGATQAEVFLAVSEFTAKIKCGHTFASFWNNPIQTQRNLFTGKDKLPLNFRWMDGKMVITRNDSTNANLTPGTLITKINGHRTEDVLAKLMTLVKGDGHNDAKRIAELQLQDLKDWEAFDIYFALAFQPEETFELEVETLSGVKSTQHVEAIDYKVRRTNRAKHAPKFEKDSVEWQTEWLDHESAILKMPSWALYNSKWDWQGWLKGFFTELRTKGAKNLILDVRGNAGGNECGDEIMRYLVPSKVTFPSGTTFIRYQKIRPELALYVSTWDRAFYDWTKETQPAQHVAELGSQAFQIRGEDSVNAERGGTIEPLEPRFTGKTYVLVDAECSSATYQFATQVRNYKVGTLVGQPTGGNCKGINGGAIFFTTLPNSQIEIDIPIIAYLPASKQPDAGLDPDVTIRDTRKDISEGRDSVLEWVKKQIGGSGEIRSASPR